MKQKRVIPTYVSGYSNKSNNCLPSKKPLGCCLLSKGSNYGKSKLFRETLTGWKGEYVGYWKGLGEPTRQRYRREATDAIEAMREPTRAMEAAAQG